jgi:hypothetical protein
MRTVNTDDKGNYTFVEYGKTHNVKPKKKPILPRKKV